MKTRITEMFGIEHPIIQGGMHYVGFAEMAAAVSNAGGLGIITGLTQRTPENLRKEIRRCREMTNKSFGVNLTFLPAITPPDYPGFVRTIIEEGIKIVDRCLQLYGGYGFMDEFPISRMYRDSRVQRIYGGANEIMKMLIARTL